IVPIFHGTGLSIKTLEALAMGRPLIVTPTGARGLEPDDDAFLRIDMQADPRQTAEAILELLESPARRQDMGNNARAYFERYFSREAYFAGMDRVMSAIGLGKAA